MTLVHDAVVLAGGQARRLGGVSKAEVLVAGIPLLDRVLAATADARRVVVVGPPELARPGVLTTMEHPTSGGPVAGIEAGLSVLNGAGSSYAAHPTDDDPWPDDAPVLVLACDVPGAAALVPGLLTAIEGAPSDVDGVHVVDADGHAQLVAVYRRSALTAALAGLVADGGVHGIAVRRLADRLRMAELADPDGHGQDADTWDDVERLDALISKGDTVPAEPSTSVEPTGGSELHRWVLAVIEDFGVDPDAVDVDLLLDLARDVAHGVARPAVPLTSFLAGYAVARTGGDRAALDRVVARAVELTDQWTHARPGRTQQEER